MRVLDRYVVFAYIRTFVAALVLFTIGAAIMDFFSRIGHFLDDGKVEDTFAEGLSTPMLVLRFYAAYMPFVIKEVLPFVTVASALFTVTQMLRDNEVLPVLAAGVSSRRLFFPLFICGAFVSVFHLGFQEFVVPSLGREQMAIKRFFSGDRTTGVENMDHLRDGLGTVTSVGSFRFGDGSLRDAVIQRPWTDAGFQSTYCPILLPDGSRWTAPEGGTVQPAGVDAVAWKLPPGARIDIGVAPDEVEALATKKGTAEISFSQLLKLARKFPQRSHLRVALHKQIARPFSGFALLLCGIPILLAAGRSILVGGAIAFGLSAAYYSLDIFLTSLGDRGDVPPMVAAYFPLALVVSIGAARLAAVPT